MAGKLPLTVEDKTDFVSKPQTEGSRVWSVSVRGWLAIVIIGTACLCSLAVVLAAVSVAIYSGSLTVLANDTVSTMFSGVKELALIALGYYFAKEEREHIRRPPKMPPEAAPA